ncbi:DUF2922 domain-containing protein [Alkalihalophilus pseudofirmus]|uniref:DUF2922 domain-containing protein n=1 Tax=Alkalihalophilus pseudofirmus TaxID=79885 RepID=A0AAJ2KW13_ALKPS|nr:DUF2922 domain-containing protein [Alkalihalophilus pseudofirmus]MDV2884080.1 DUF2922 domain-containing protein [Alkalihalophilus pseudofirmus]
MARVLEMLFLNQEGKQVSITLDDPIEPADPEAILQVMNKVIEKNVYTSSGGDFVSIKGARITERAVEVIELPAP